MDTHHTNLIKTELIYNELTSPLHTDILKAYNLSSMSRLSKKREKTRGII